MRPSLIRPLRALGPYKALEARGTQGTLRDLPRPPVDRALAKALAKEAQAARKPKGLVRRPLRS